MPRIAVVDDSALIRRKVGEFLVAAGHDVVAIGSGEEAVERTLLEPFDLVISDVRMGAMTGIQLCRVLRSDPITATLPIVLLSASDDARTRFWGRHAGVNAYLSKDGVFDTLVPTVDRLLARATPARTDLRRPTHVDAAARVSSVLDRHLFDAVVASEARSLLAYCGDRDALLGAALELVHDVIGTPYASLTLFGRRTSHVVVARGPMVRDDAILAALHLEQTMDPPVVARDPAFQDPAEDVAFGERETFDLEAVGERLGVLRLYPGTLRIGADDRSTARLLADSLAPVVKSLVLVEETRHLAQTDALSGLSNRRALVERLELEDARARRYGCQLSVVIVDVDHFKSINDTFGHGVGDDVLRKVASVIRDAVRTVDLAGRWGGEEFLVVLPECDSAGALVVAERVRAAIEAMPPIAGGTRTVTVSCGVATRTKETPSAIALVEMADDALYHAKRSGRNRVEQRSA